MTANKGKVLLQVQGLEKKFDDNQVLDGITTCLLYTSDAADE